jgi:hypothetical protein
MVDFLVAVFTIYMIYRCITIARYLTGPMGNFNIQMLSERFITGKNSCFVSMLDGSIRGIAIGLSPMFGSPLLTAVLITHTCITAAGITTALQRHLSNS